MSEQASSCFEVTVCIRRPGWWWFLTLPLLIFVSLVFEEDIPVSLPRTISVVGRRSGEVLVAYEYGPGQVEAVGVHAASLRCRLATMTVPEFVADLGLSAVPDADSLSS